MYHYLGLAVSQFITFMQCFVAFIITLFVVFVSITSILSSIPVHDKLTKSMLDGICLLLQLEPSRPPATKSGGRPENFECEQPIYLQRYVYRSH